jgi:hypothetical protein
MIHCSNSEIPKMTDASKNYYHRSLSVSHNYCHRSFSVSQNYCHRSLSVFHPKRCLYITFMDIFLNMINLGMNVVKVTAFKTFNFVNFVVVTIISP